VGIKGKEDFWAKIWRGKYVDNIEENALIHMKGEMLSSLIWNNLSLIQNHCF
jgi:hypothetical protein